MTWFSTKKLLSGATIICLLILLLTPLAYASYVVPAPRDLKVKNPDITYGVSISWVVDDTTTISGLELYRSVGDESNYTLLSSMNPMETGVQDQSIARDTMYYYKIRAYYKPWEGGTFYSDYSPRVSIRIPARIEDPAAPTDLEGYLEGNVAVLTWNDNAENEEWFEIQRSTDNGVWGNEASAQPSYKTGKVTYRYVGLTPGTTNKFRVRAIRVISTGWVSPYSNEVTLIVSASTPIPGSPIAPANLAASVFQKKAIALSWKDNSDNEDCFYLSRRANNESDWKILEQLPAGSFSYNDWDVKPGVTYSYKVEAANHSGRSLASNVVTFVAPSAQTEQPKPKPKQLRFFIDSFSYYVNDSMVAMEVAPTVYHDRTMLPIAYIADPIGAQTTWDEASGKITISLNNKTIELWLGSNTARVNGAAVSIDANDLAVTPLVLPPGRTMVPLGFIAQNLGCTVNWNAATREVTINYFGK